MIIAAMLLSDNQEWNHHRRINLGRSFQADIPPLRNAKYTQLDSHNALLAWRPLDKLEDPVNQQRGTQKLRDENN